jgi:hypothetical protein
MVSQEASYDSTLPQMMVLSPSLSSLLSPSSSSSSSSSSDPPQASAISRWVSPEGRCDSVSHLMSNLCAAQRTTKGFRTWPVAATRAVADAMFASWFGLYALILAQPLEARSDTLERSATLDAYVRCVPELEGAEGRPYAFGLKEPALALPAALDLVCHDSVRPVRTSLQPSLLPLRPE